MNRVNIALLCAAVLTLAPIQSIASAQECGLEESILFANDGAADDQFGLSVALFGNDAIVGTGNGNSAYLFDAINGTQYRKLTSTDSGVGGFGWSVASTGFNVYIGAPLSVNPSGTATPGTAFMFTAFNGAQILRYDPNDGGNTDYFGSSIAVSGNIVAVGSPLVGANNFGAVYLFDRTSSFQIGKLMAENGIEFDQMGQSIAVENQILVAGAPRHSSDTTTSGAAFVFDINTQAQTMTLLNDGSTGDRFGYSVAIGGGYILVGAPFDQTVSLNSGAVYIFDKDTGVLIQKLLPTEDHHLAINGRLGYSISIHGNRAIIGGPGVQDYALLLDLPSLQVIAELNPSDPPLTSNLFFGGSVAMSDSSILIGAMLSDDSGMNSGSAYRFDVNPMSCPADIDDNCVVNFFDISNFLTAFGDMDPIADINNDGIYDFFDVSAFLSAFAAGCP